MSTRLISSPDIPRVSDLLDRLGGISADRVRYYPLPGTATEQDVIDIEARENRSCELVDGVLVEKAMRFDESLLAGIILSLLNSFVLPRKLGAVTGPDGMLRLLPGVVRAPDVAFISSERLRALQPPREPIPSLAPDLAVEVISASNTIKEIERKRGEYFAAGVRLIWIVNHRPRTVTIYLPAGEPTTLGDGDTLGGEPVLPGFSVEVAALFDMMRV